MLMLIYYIITDETYYRQSVRPRFERESAMMASRALGDDVFKRHRHDAVVRTRSCRQAATQRHTYLQMPPISPRSHDILSLMTSRRDAA